MIFRASALVKERINELLRTHRVRIQSSKLRARDEILRKRLLVLLQLLLPTGSVDNDAVTDSLRVAHELNETRQAVGAVQGGIVEAIDEISRLLKLCRKEVSCRNILSFRVDALCI